MESWKQSSTEARISSFCRERRRGIVTSVRRGRSSRSDRSIGPTPLPSIHTSTHAPDTRRPHSSPSIAHARTHLVRVAHDVEERVPARPEDHREVVQHDDLGCGWCVWVGIGWLGRVVNRLIGTLDRSRLTQIDRRSLPSHSGPNVRQTGAGTRGIRKRLTLGARVVVPRLLEQPQLKGRLCVCIYVCYWVDGWMRVSRWMEASWV